MIFNKILYIFIILIAIPIFSVAQIRQNIKLKEGIWRAVLTLKDEIELPFNFEVDKSGKLLIMNAEERILTNEIEFIDSNKIKILLPVFSTYIEAELEGETLKGYWVNPEKKDYQIPFFAQAGPKDRFAATESAPLCDISGNWEVSFSPGTNSEYKAIGIFKQKSNKVTGTFLTETGDYRYLEGQIEEGSLKLSCFDGAHAFLFTANVSKDNFSNGVFYSGKHWSEPWIAVKNEKFTLSDPDTLTYLKTGFDKIDFSFPDENGDTISLSDEKFRNKAIIVQIMGSWCPNCMDESVYLSEVYKKYKSKGLEIIAIDYEIRNDIEVFKSNVARLKKDLGIDYKIVFGGPSKKSEAAKTLPMLNHIMSYPTTIFIDRKGKIRKIQTGFNGPGTGKIYEDYKKSTDKLIEKILK
jgi:thiol-disulfide isomerase/thioredoxin